MWSDTDWIIFGLLDRSKIEQDGQYFRPSTNFPPTLRRCHIIGMCRTMGMPLKSGNMLMKGAKSDN